MQYMRNSFKIVMHVAGDAVPSPETFIVPTCSHCANSQTIHKHHNILCIVEMHNISLYYGNNTG